MPTSEPSNNTQLQKSYHIKESPFHTVRWLPIYSQGLGSNCSLSCLMCTVEGNPFELDTITTKGCCWKLCSEGLASSTVPSGASDFTTSWITVGLFSGALMTEVITALDGGLITCELLGVKVTTGAAALKDGEEAMLTVPLQIVCMLLLSTWWTCAGLKMMEEGDETGLEGCNTTFSLSTVMGCEAGMAWRINFWAVVADVGSALAITVVRGTVWSVTACSCWFPGETTTGTCPGVWMVLLK